MNKSMLHKLDPYLPWYKYYNRIDSFEFYTGFILFIQYIAERTKKIMPHIICVSSYSQLFIHSAVWAQEHNVAHMRLFNAEMSLAQLILGTKDDVYDIIVYCCSENNIITEIQVWDTDIWDISYYMEAYYALYTQYQKNYTVLDANTHYNKYVLSNGYAFYISRQELLHEDEEAQYLQYIRGCITNFFDEKKSWYYSMRLYKHMFRNALQWHILVSEYPTQISLSARILTQLLQQYYVYRITDEDNELLEDFSTIMDTSTYSLIQYEYLTIYYPNIHIWMQHNDTAATAITWYQNQAGMSCSAAYAIVDDNYQLQIIPQHTLFILVVLGQLCWMKHSQQLLYTPSLNVIVIDSAAPSAIEDIAHFFSITVYRVAGDLPTMKTYARSLQNQGYAVKLIAHSYTMCFLDTVYYLSDAACIQYYLMRLCCMHDDMNMPLIHIWFHLIGYFDIPFQLQLSDILDYIPVYSTQGLYQANTHIELDNAVMYYDVLAQYKSLFDEQWHIRTGMLLQLTSYTMHTYYMYGYSVDNSYMHSIRIELMSEDGIRMANIWVGKVSVMYHISVMVEVRGEQYDLQEQLFFWHINIVKQAEQTAIKNIHLK